MSNIAGASTPLKFADGLEIALAPLNDKDMVELDQWIRSFFLEITLKDLEKLPDRVQDRYIAQAQKQALGLTFMSGDGAKLMATVDGMTRLIWQMAKKENPKLTLPELRQRMLNPENIEAANRAFSLTHPSSGDNEKNSGKDRRRKKRKKRV